MGRRSPPLPGLAGLGGGLDMAGAGPSTHGDAARRRSAAYKQDRGAGQGGRRCRPSLGSRSGARRAAAGGRKGGGEGGRAEPGGREEPVLRATPPTGGHWRFASPSQGPANPRARPSPAPPLSSLPLPAAAGAGGAQERKAG